MGTSGSPRGAKVDGIPYNVATDADIALNNRISIESTPHSGGNMNKITTESGSAEAVKFILERSEYETLQAQGATGEDMSLSFTAADGETYRTVGTINIGQWMSADKSCEVEYLTSTGIWD